MLLYIFFPDRLNNIYNLTHVAIGRAFDHQTADSQHQRIGASLCVGANPFCEN